MSLQDQINGIGGGGDQKFIFKEGVRFKHMTGKDPITFRLAPAYNAAIPDPTQSWVPLITMDGGTPQVSEFGQVLYICRFIGHGAGGFGTRRDLLSLRSFAAPGQEVYDPLETLLKCIKQMSAEWGYLLEDKMVGQTKERAAFSRPTSHLITNVLDLNQSTVGIQLGVFSTSATTALIHSKTGLIFQPSAQATEEAIKSDPMAAYANGDLTHPTNGASLICQKGQAQGGYSKYAITLAVDPQSRQVHRRALTAEEMGQRYNLAALKTFINIPTEEELVQSLTELLNMRAPNTGYHEWALLKMAFPQYRVPEPPAAAAASPTIPAGGFSASPAGAVPAAPAAAGPGGNAVMGTPVAAAAAAAAAAPVAPAAPAAAPVAPAAAPVAPVAAAPVAPAAAPVAPVAAPVAPAAAAPAAAPVAPVAAAPVAPAAAPVAPAAAPVEGAPVAAVPGDAVPEFDKEHFLGRIQTMGADAAPAG